MKRKTILTALSLLVFLTAAYIMVISDGSTSTLEFISIFAIGIISGVVLTMLMAGKILLENEEDEEEVKAE